MSFAKKILVSLLRILSGIPIVTLFAVGVLFFLFSETWSGRSFGASATLLSITMFCAIGYWNRPWFANRRWRFFGGLLATSAVLYLLPMSVAPDGRGAADGRVQNCFLNGKSSFHRFSPWNVIPEVDQITVGTHILPWSDPYVDLRKAKRIRSLEAPIYESIERDDGFHSLGCVMGLAYREVFRIDFDTGHYYLFLPEVAPGKRLPCLVFLHGWGGNRRAHLWVLSQISAQMKCAVIAPTFGLGNWDKDGGAQLVVDVTREALAKHPIDPDRIFLLGYSNGAMGVTRAAIAKPELFRGLIYLSPVTEDELFWRSEFLSTYRGRKILFLHGANDQRIPSSVVANTVSLLEGNGCEVEFALFEDEDHYLLLSQPQPIADAIVKHMTGSTEELR